MHPTHNNKTKQGHIIVKFRQVALTAWASEASVSSTSGQAVRTQVTVSSTSGQAVSAQVTVSSTSGQAVRAQVTSSEVWQLLSGLHSCSSDSSSPRPPQVSWQSLRLSFPQKWVWIVERKVTRAVRVERPRYPGISLEHTAIRCTTFHPPHDKSMPCGSRKQKCQMSPNWVKFSGI